MSATLKLRRDTSANWASVNPVLNSGEPGYETDTNLLKIGDGSTNYNSLPYFSSGSTTQYINLINSTNQALPNGTMTDLSFDSYNSYTNPNIHSNAAPTSLLFAGFGFMRVTVRLVTDASSPAAGIIAVFIRANGGGLYTAGGAGPNGANDPAANLVSFILPQSQIGSSVQVTVGNSTGGTINALAGFTIVQAEVFN